MNEIDVILPYNKHQFMKVITDHSFDAFDATLLKTV